jgi:hypothetical protein
MINIEMRMSAMKKNTIKMEMVNTMEKNTMKMSMILTVAIPMFGLEKIIYSS